MKPTEVAALLRRPPRPADRDARRLAACHDIADLRSRARRRLPRSVFDYVDGGAEREWTLAANERAFTNWTFAPRIGCDVGTVSTQTTVAGAQISAPLGLAPTGYTRMVDPDGEVAVARAAGAARLPYTLSTVGTSTVDEIGATGLPERWMQLYVLRDRELTQALVARAAAAGFTTLAVSLDVPVAGLRVRDARNGFTIPPSLTASTLLDIAGRPRYWSRMLAAPALDFANLSRPGADATIASITSLFDPTVTWADIAWLRSVWPGQLYVKGPAGAEDARRAVEAGCDGVWLSNHGGRQLDPCVAALDLVSEVRAAVGDTVTVLVDSGIRHGSDIAVAVALGADAAMVGRPYLYGLAAGGQQGVARAIELLTASLARTMALIGVRSIDELRADGPSLLRQHSGGGR